MIGNLLVGRRLLEQPRLQSFLCKMHRRSCIQVSLSAEGRSRHRASGGRCAVATDPAHVEVGLPELDPALRFVNEAAVGLCFHATRLVQLTRWHVVTRCGVGREEVLDGIHYEAG